MKCTQILLLIAASVCMAQMPWPYHSQLSLVDQVVAAAKADPSKGPVALEILQRVAEGRMAAGSPDLELRVGLAAGQLRGPEFKVEEVRSDALRKIGDLDLPGALAYLQNLGKDDFEWDTTGQMWSAAQIALRQAQLIRIPDQQGKIAFLEDTTTEKTSAAAWWAADQLCDLGVHQSLPFVRQYLEAHLSLSRDIEEPYQFCQERMDIVSRDPDRVKALASVLSVNSGVTDSEILEWAINELRSMKSPRAEAEVQRYADEIEALPDGSDLKKTLWDERVEIRGMTPPRRK